MKIKFIIFAVILITVQSCDFLEISPETFLSSADYFQTQEDFEQAINGTYAGLHNFYNEAFVMGEMRSDNTHYIFKSGDRGEANQYREQIADFLEDEANYYTNYKWSYGYVIIANANQVLSRIDDVSFDDEVKKGIKGEALFLRSFIYYDLVQYFGELPLHLMPSTGLADAALPKSSLEEIYKQIMDDTKEAISLLPEKSAQAKGRATKGAARILLAYMNMSNKGYQQAEILLKEIISSGEYELLSNYAAIYEPTNKNHKESLFEIQYLQGTMGVANNYIYKFIPGMEDTKILTGVSGNNQSIGGWNTPTPDLLASYETGDLRKDASIGFYSDVNGTYPYIKKYLHEHQNYNNTDDNWPVYRYADVILLLAEALNEQNKTSEALTFINNTYGSTSIRERAGLTPLTAQNQVELRDLIAHERRIELAFENHRWLDLVRTGKAIEVMNKYGQQVKEHPENYYYPIATAPLAQSYNLTEKRLLFPIPERQQTLNPNLK